MNRSIAGKIFTTIFLSVVTGGISAHAQLRYSVLGGVTNSKISIKEFTLIRSKSIGPNTFLDERVLSRTLSGISFFGGFKFDYDLTNNISLSTRLVLDNVRFRQDIENRMSTQGNGGILGRDSVFGEDIIGLLYLSVPFHLIFYAPLKKSRLYVGVGGYISYGISGYNEFKSTYSSTPTITDSIMQITFSSNEKVKSASYHTRRFDYGISLISGIQFRNKLFIEAGFDNGMNSVFKDRFITYFRQNTFLHTVVHRFSNRKREFRLGIGYRIK